MTLTIEHQNFLYEVSDFLLGHGHEAAANQVADYAEENNNGDE